MLNLIHRAALTKFPFTLQCVLMRALKTCSLGDFMASVISSSEKIKSGGSLTTSEIVGMINLFKKPCKYTDWFCGF